MYNYIQNINKVRLLIALKAVPFIKEFLVAIMIAKLIEIDSAVYEFNHTHRQYNDIYKDLYNYKIYF